jgi:dextranase
MKSFNFFVLIIVSFFSFSCKGAEPEVIHEAPANVATPAYSNVSISTDKAVYKPGDNVTFTIAYSSLPTTAKVRYKYANTTISESNITGSTWSWTTPATISEL